MENKKLYIHKSNEEFHNIGEINSKRIKAYNDIANDYNVSISVIRDVFSLGILFALSNLKEVGIPSEHEIDGNLTIIPEEGEGQHVVDYNDGYIQGRDDCYDYFINKLK